MPDIYGVVFLLVMEGHGLLFLPSWWNGWQHHIQPF